jgi:hypothetical protein
MLGSDRAEVDNRHMKQRRSPQEKKQLSYDRDGRNAFGDNDKAARKTIPRRKRKRARAIRRITAQQLRQTVEDASDDGIEMVDQKIAAAKRTAKDSHWRKHPDIPLREWVERKRKWRNPVIYVELLNEAVPVWRPVRTTLESGVYRLPSEKPDDEIWAFPPGSRVLAEWRRLGEGKQQLVACALAD